MTGRLVLARLAGLVAAPLVVADLSGAVLLPFLAYAVVLSG
jgi:hypothetical protein